MSLPQHAFGAQEQQNLEFLVGRALDEDLGFPGDITSKATIPADARGAARLVARSPGVLAGLPAVELLCRKLELGSGWRANLSDGDVLEEGSVIGKLAGPMQSLLALERTALNFLQRLSGIATLTARYVTAVGGTRAVIFDTRKTTPGWRFLEKYAVRCGGGANHRFGLYDAVLIKDNHLAWINDAACAAGQNPIASAIASAQKGRPPARPSKSKSTRSSSSSSPLEALPISYSLTTWGLSTSRRPSAGVTRRRPGYSSRPPAA